jgi:putative transposase
VSPLEKRKGVAHLMEARGMSERRARKTTGCYCMTVRYRTTRADDAGLRQHMRAVVEVRRRFGYRACVFCSSRRAIWSTTGCRGSIGKRA